MSDIFNFYENDLQIDAMALDEEWLDQPALFWEYSKKAADAQKAYDKAKEKLEFTKSDLTLRIKSSPEDFMDIATKPTLPDIAAAIETNDEFTEANKEMIQANYERNIALGAVKAFEQRKSALEALVKLHGQNYFSSPVEPRNLTNDYTEKAKKRRSRKSVKEAMNSDEKPERRRRRNTE